MSSICYDPERDDCVSTIEAYCKESTNMTDDEAYDFALRVWQMQGWLASYLVDHLVKWRYHANRND